MTAQTRGSAAIALAAGLWGLWGLAIKASGLGGRAAAALAMTVIAVAAAPLLPRRLSRDPRLWGLLALTGLCDAGNCLFFFEALQRGPLAVAVLSHYLAPVIIALLSPLLLRTWPRASIWAALPVSLAGLVLLLGEDALALGVSATTSLLGAASALFYALNVLVQKRIGDRLTPAEILVWHAAFSALVLWPLAFGAEAFTASGAAWIMGAALVCGVGGGLLFLWGLTRTTAARAGVLTYLEPAVGVGVGALVFGEPLAAWAPLGIVLVVLAGLGVLRAGER